MARRQREREREREREELGALIFPSKANDLISFH
jgi:hypothetical protein